MADDVKKLNSILDKLTSPGKLEKGVKGSETDAKGNWAKVKNAKDLQALAEKQGTQRKIPPAVILGMMSRESGFGLGQGMSKDGWGDRGNAYGVLQVDKRAHKPAGTDKGPLSDEHVNQALDIFDGYRSDVKKAHKDWSEEEVLAGAICAYNANPKNVQTSPKKDWRALDKNGDAVDYSADVWAQAVYYKNTLWPK